MPELGEKVSDGALVPKYWQVKVTLVVVPAGQMLGEMPVMTGVWSAVTVSPTYWSHPHPY
jgi:hypothetical protein